MNLWIVLPVLGAIAVLFVVLPVGMAMTRRFRRPQGVRCPLALRPAAIRIARAGLAEIVGRRSLRQVAACSLWAPNEHCDQHCLAVPDAALEDALLGRLRRLHPQQDPGVLQAARGVRTSGSRPSILGERRSGSR